MLRISKLADYTIVIMNEIAGNSNPLLSAKDIAGTTHLTETTVSKLLKLLVKANLLISQQGAKGGYQLARPAKDMTLAQIIAVMDGEIAMTECDRIDGCCSVEKHCTISSNWRRISHAIRDALSNISLADMNTPLPQPIVQFNK